MISKRSRHILYAMKSNGGDFDSALREVNSALKSENLIPLDFGEASDALRCLFHAAHAMGLYNVPLDSLDYRQMERIVRDALIISRLEDAKG